MAVLINLVTVAIDSSSLGVRNSLVIIIITVIADIS